MLARPAAQAHDGAAMTRLKRSTVRPAKQPPALSSAAKPRVRRTKLRESLGARRARAQRILRKLHEFHGEVTTALEHKNAWQLLVSTILSAQSTDDTVNRITPILFATYSTPEALAAAPVEEIETIIRPTGFFRQKTKSIKAASQSILENFGGQVPDTMKGLVKLRGVARKTANVVLGTFFGKNEGVVVDTHVGRVATRLGLTWRSKNEKDAVKIERDLMEVIPREEWSYFSHALIWHGRKVCTARRPNCAGCVLNADCPSAFAFETTSKSRRRRADARSEPPACPPVTGP
jgi:endonuclease-3